MAPRFLVLQTQDLSRSRRCSAAVSSAVPSRFEGRGNINIFHNLDCTLHRLNDDSSVALGRVFRGSNFHSIAHRDLGRLLGNNGRAILDRCWGQYVLVEFRSSDSFTVLRDPSGGLPCYLVANAHFRAAASDVDLLVAAGLLAPRISWEAIQYHLLYPNHRGDCTALDRLSELPSGCLTTLSGTAMTIQQVWLPWRFTDHAAETDRMSAITSLRRAVDGSVAAIAREFDSPPIAGVSGGLDSSIMLSALAKAGISPRCITLATQDPEGDERPFARVVCDVHGCALDEIHYRLSDINILRPSAPHLPRPAGATFLQSYNRRAIEVARRIGAKALFKGNGGDAVFCFMQNVTPALDQLKSIRQWGALPQTIFDISRITECGLPEILGEMWRKLSNPSAPPSEKRDPRFLAEREIPFATFPAHPWLHPPTDVPKGRANHAEWILRVQRFTEGFDRSDPLELVCPLVSQPIIEASLAIPSWLWVQGGVNRSIARQAYRDVLPRQVLGHVRKGGPAPFTLEILEAERSRIRDFLLGGLLNQKGVIDAHALEIYLDQRGPQKGHDYLRVMELVDVEAWARHWSGAGALSARAGS